jgi:hypothetical protein
MSVGKGFSLNFDFHRGFEANLIPVEVFEAFEAFPV